MTCNAADFGRKQDNNKRWMVMESERGTTTPPSNVGKRIWLKPLAKSDVNFLL